MGFALLVNALWAFVGGFVWCVLLRLGSSSVLLFVLLLGVQPFMVPFAGVAPDGLLSSSPGRVVGQGGRE